MASDASGEGWSAFFSLVAACTDQDESGSTAETPGLKSALHGLAGMPPGSHGMFQSPSKPAAALRTMNRVTVTEDGVKLHLCPQDGCAKKFKSRSNLNRHHRIHTGEKPYMCDLCGRQFNESTNLNTHLRQVHKTVRSNEEQAQRRKILKTSGSKSKNTSLAAR